MRISKAASSMSMLQKYNITISELQDLIQFQGQKGINNIQHYGGIEKLYIVLNTTPEFGINGTTEKLIQHRRSVFGKNAIEPPKSKTFFELALMALNDPILIFLEVGGLFSIIISLFERYFQHESENNYSWIEGVAIIVSVLIIVLVTATTDYGKEKQFRSLQKHLLSENKIPVIRNGDITDISVTELVVGDICLIKYGNVIPADGILIQSNDLKIDESSLTGESDLVNKSIEKDIIVLSGTYVMEGSGTMLIVAVGIYSQNGIILKLLGFNSDDKDKDKKEIDNNNKERSSALNIQIQEKLEISKDKSILQIKLLKIAYNISKAATLIAIMLIIILLTEFTYIFITEHKEWHTNCINEIIEYLLTSVSILVIAIPEGLPLAVTLSLAYSVRKMTFDNNLVRNLAACETMGNATIICSDKTGTLTTNRMTCVEIYTCEKLYRKIPVIERIPLICGKLITEGISVNSLYTSRLIFKIINKIEQIKQIGNKTECALLGLVNDFHINYELIRTKYPENEFIHVYTFNSIRKSMSTVIKINDDNYRLYTKGASEIVMIKCNYIYDLNGQMELFTSDMKSNLYNKVIIPMANNGYRTITIAYRDIKLIKPINMNELYIDNINEVNWNDEDYIVNDLTLLCVCGILDPVRPEVPNSIRLCQSAGISVRMVTGDNIITAKSIAIKCGIINIDDNFLIMEGTEFNSRIRDIDGIFNQKKFDKIWPRLRVLARSTPTDKYVLVKGIIDSKITRHREVVAVTGDGTNDGPALKIADVGFAMGISGTDVAKEASDIIITDDNFSSIVKAVMWGRNIYDSISKFIQFQLTVNLVAVTIACVSAIITHQSVVKAVQLLWVNLIMDSLASLALATEKPTENILKRKPYGRTKSIITTRMLINIFLQAIYQLTVLALILFYFHRLLNIPHGATTDLPSKHYTLLFNTLVMMTLFNEINSRKLHGEKNIFTGLFSNHIFLIIWIITFTLQLLIVQHGGYVFHTESLNLQEWLWCLVFGFGTMIWALIYNRFPIELWFKNIYFTCCKKRVQRELEGTLEEDEDKSSPWFRSSKRLTTQLNVIRRLSIRNEEDADSKRSISKRYMSR